jgi:CheY-like chemotaxis protein
MTADEFLHHLHHALNHLYEPDRLRQNPLAEAFRVANRFDTFVAMQRILIDAIQSFEPAADEPAESMAWEIYEPLYYRYVHQLTQSQVAKQIGMSVRHLRRKEHVAVEVLAGHLWKEFNLEAESRTYEEVHSPLAHGQDAPTVSDELAWLRDAPLENPADLGRILAEAQRLAQVHADRHLTELDLSIADDLPSLAVHEVVLSQTLLGLLGVAIHRASGGRVYVTAEQQHRKVQIRISGARSATASHHAPDDDQASLKLARQLTSLCRGQLDIVDDERLFCARLTLPLLEQLPVLVIDDNADTLQLLRRYSAGSRYHLFTTQDPETALVLAVQHRPEIIVLDVMMPGMDGWKVLTQLRQHPSTEQIPIVVCTILPQRETALSLGASGFVRKPVTRRSFLVALDDQLDAVATRPPR